MKSKYKILSLCFFTLIVRQLCASPHRPEGADADAIRNAILATSPEDRVAALSMVSNQSAAAFQLTEIFAHLGLVPKESMHPISSRILQTYRKDIHDATTGKKRTIMQFPPLHPDDRFDTHPRVGTYMGNDRIVHVVELSVNGFFVMDVNERFWTGQPELLAMGLFENEMAGRGEFNGWTVTIEGTILELVSPQGSKEVLHQSNFENSALGTLPPPGATVLIDSKGNPVGVETDWKTVDQALEITKGGFDSGRSITGSIRAHLEFRVANNPNNFNQRRGNSGLFLDAYEIQINDNFGFPHAVNRCGGLYFIAAPLRNASLPPGEWQVYDAVFTPDLWDENEQLQANARISVWMNGVLIHDDVELKYSDEKRQAAKKKIQHYSLRLQDHGNRLQFRNFWWQSMDGTE